MLSMPVDDDDIDLVPDITSVAGGSRDDRLTVDPLNDTAGSTLPVMGR